MSKIRLIGEAVSRLPNTTQSLGFIVGRFQIPHSGHQLLLEKAIQVHGYQNVRIILGSSQPTVDRKDNPFSSIQRANMLRRMLEKPIVTPDQKQTEYGDTYEGQFSNFILHKDEAGNPDALAQTIRGVLTDAGVDARNCRIYYTDKKTDHTKYGNQRKHYLADIGIPLHSMPLLNNTDGSILSSTTLRKILRTQGCYSIEPHIHPMVFSYIRLCMAAAFISGKPVYEIDPEEEEGLLGSASRMLHKYSKADFILTESGTVQTATPAIQISTSARHKASFPPKPEKAKKLAIVGMGWSGLATLHAIMQKDVLKPGDQLVGIESTAKRAKGLWDDFNALNIGKNITFIPAGIDQPQALEGTDILFMLTSKPLPSGTIKSRNWGLEGNLPICTKVAQGVREYAPDAMIVVGSNPVEPLCAEFVRMGISPTQVIGKTGIDTERFRRYLCDTISRKHSKWCTDENISINVVFNALSALQERCCMVGMHEPSYMIPVVDMEAIVAGRPIHTLLNKSDIEICARAAMYEGLARTNQLRSPSIGAGLYNARYADAALNGGDVFASTLIPREKLLDLLPDNKVLVKKIEESAIPIFYSTRTGLGECRIQTVLYPDPAHVLLAGRPLAKGIIHQVALWKNITIPAAHNSDNISTTLVTPSVSTTVGTEKAKGL